LEAGLVLILGIFAAALGDEGAETVIKLIKQAKKKANKYKGK
jgi:hypothetical protein